MQKENKEEFVVECYVRLASPNCPIISLSDKRFGKDKESVKKEYMKYVKKSLSGTGAWWNADNGCILKSSVISFSIEVKKTIPDIVIPIPIKPRGFMSRLRSLF